MSQNLASETRKYSAKAKDLAFQALIQKYMPLIVVGGFLFMFLFIRYYVFGR